MRTQLGCSCLYWHHASDYHFIYGCHIVRRGQVNSIMLQIIVDENGLYLVTQRSPLSVRQWSGLKILARYLRLNQEGEQCDT